MRLQGETQVDFGHALVKMSGVLRKICFFVTALPYSDVFFIRAYERECTETFRDGHVRAFAFFGGVPQRITYDNSNISMSIVSSVTYPANRPRQLSGSSFAYNRRIVGAKSARRDRKYLQF